MPETWDKSRTKENARNLNNNIGKEKKNRKKRRGRQKGQK
jgi:hypothetical protein